MFPFILRVSLKSNPESPPQATKPILASALSITLRALSETSKSFEQWKRLVAHHIHLIDLEVRYCFYK